MDKLSEYLIPKSELSPEARTSGGTDVRSYLSPVGIKELRPNVDVRDYEKYFEPGQVPISSPFLDDLRARNQSRWDKWANGIVRGVVTAGTTAVEPFVDLLIGAPAAMFSGDASKVYDNGLSRLLDTLNESAREAMPIYKDRQYEEAGFAGRVSRANFWAEDFTQGIGFMAGAVLSTFMGAGLLNAAKVPGFAKGAYSAVSNAMRGKNAGTSAGMLGDLTANVAGKAGADAFGKSVMSKAIGLMAAAGESGIEARGAKDSVRAELERRNSEMPEGSTKFSEEEIDKISSQAGNASFAVNMALVGGSNIVQFDNIVKGFLGVNAAATGATSMVGKGLLARAAAATTKTGKALVYGKAALMNPLTETFQEGGQFVTEKYLEDMMGRLYDPTAVNSVNDYMDGFGRALEETFGSTEGQTSMFLGALLGAIGMPGLGGGIYGDVKEANKRFAAEQVAADAINKTHLGNKFAGLHRTATYSANYARRQEEALASGDPFTVIDAEMDNFKTYLLELAAAGRLDIAEQHLEGIMDLVAAVEDGSDPTALAQYMEATGFTEKTGPESIASMREFAEFFKTGIKRAEAVQSKIAPFAEVHPELGRLVGDLLMSEGNYDQLIEKAQKTMNDIASANKMSFNFEEVFNSENPSQELNGLVSKYINTYKIDPTERKALQAAKSMLLGAEGQKALIKQAYDYISSEEKNGYAELVESMTAKKAMFNRMAKNKQTKTTLVEGMEWENEDDKALFDQSTMVEDGDFISGEFEIDIPVSKPRKGPPTEFNELLTPEQIEAEIDDWYKARGLNRAEEEAKGTEEIGVEKATGTFLPNGDIRVVDSTGKVSIFKKGPNNYARIDQSTLKRPQEIKAKTETAKIRGIVVQLGEVVKAKLADNATTAATLKEKIAEIESAVKAAQLKVFDKGTTAKMVKDFKKATKALEAAAQEISEQLTVLSEQRDILEKERLLLLEEYKYLQQDGMTAAEYIKRRDSMVESQTELDQHIEDKSNLLTYLTSLIEKLKAFISRLTKPLGAREGAVVSDVAVVVEDLTADEFELAEDAGTLLSSYAIQRDINNISNDLAQLKERAAVLDQTVPVLNAIIKKYNQRVAAERRAAKKAAMQKKAGLEANPLSPTTEIQDQQVIYKDGTEAPKGTIHEVFKSTTGNHPERTALGNAWFKFTETLTPTEMEEFKLVPVIAEANQFQELFSEFGVEFVDTTEGKDIKLVVVDAQGAPVMRFGLPLVTSMALPKATWNYGSGEQRFVATDSTIANEVMAAYAKERMVIVEQLTAGKTDYRFDLTGKRRGVPILDPNFIAAARPDNLADMAENPHKSVVGVLAESEQEAEKLTVGVAVDVAPGTRGRTTAQSGATATMRAGAVFVDTGAAVVPLIKRRITQQEAGNILNMIKMMITQRSEYLAAVKANSPNASKLKETYAYFPGTRIKIKEHLENLLAWGNLNKEFPEYNIYLSRSETSAGELHVGSSVYEVNELFEENSVAGQAVVDFLLRKFHHVNAKTLKTKRAFQEVTVADDLTVTTKEYPSYKSYLISPNGREQKNVPLGTWLIDQSPEDPSVNQYMSVNLTYDTRIAAPMPSTTPGTQTANSEDVEDLLAKIEADELARAGKPAPQEFGETAGFTGEVNEDEMNAAIEAAAQAEEARQRKDEQENQKPAAVSDAVVEDMWAAIEAAELARTNAKAVDKAAPSAKPVAPVRVVEETSFDEDADDLGIDYEDGVDRRDDSAPRVLATELTEELNWFQNAFSKAEKLIIANMSNAGVLGRVTRAGQVLINNITSPGTVYHEAFHLVSNFYMPSKQQRALWNEWRERTGKKNATDLEAEEGLAEDFRMYAETGGTVMPKYQDRSWFKKLYDFLKNFITRSKSIETIFQDIYEGKYATQGRQARTLSVALNRMSGKDLRDQMDIKDSNSSQLLELMDAFTMQVMAEVHAMSKLMNIPPLDIISGKPIIDPATGQPARNAKGNVRRYSNQIYLLAMNQLVKQYNALAAMPTRDDKLNAQMSVIEGVLRNKTAFLQFHVDYMRDSQLNVKFQRNTKTTVADAETGDTIQDMIDEQEIGGRLTWDWIDSVQVDPTSQTTPELKVLFTGIRKTFAGNKLSGATLGLPKMAPVKDLISYLQVELAGIRTFPDMIEKVRSLTSARPELQVILDRLKIPASGPITPINLSEGHKKMQDAFFRQFAKAPYNFQLLLKNREGELVMFNSNRQRNEDRILNAWEAALPSSISSREDFVEIKAGRRQFNPDYKFKFGPGREFSLKNMQKNEVAKALSFADRLQVLAAFGITFERPDGISAKVIQAAFPSIVNYVVANPSLNTFFKNNRKGKLSISQDLRKLALEALKVSSSRIDLQHQTADGKTIYGVGDYNYLMNLFTQLRDDVLPDQWNPELNITAKGSHWLSSPNRSELEVQLLSGFKNDQSKEGNEASKLDTATLMATYFHAFNAGIMPIPRTAEKNLVYGVRIPEDLKVNSLNQAVEILQNHLRAELETMMALDLEGTGSDIQYYKDRAKELRMFAGITVNPSNLMSQEDVEFFVDQAKPDLEAYLLRERQTVEELLEAYGLFTRIPNSTSVQTVLKPTAKTGSRGAMVMSKEDFDTMVSGFTYNSLIANMEATKLLYGDLAFFKTNEEFFKRTPGAVGTKLLPRLDEDNLLWLNENRMRMDERDRDGSMRVVTFDDVTVGTTVAELENIHPGKYGKMDEADAQGWTSVDGYRDFHLFNNSWSPEQEAAFQKIREGSPLSQKEVGLFGPFKPMYFGPQAGVNIMAPTYLKTSLMPLIPDFFRHQAAASNLKALYDQMVEKQLDIVIMNSGNKLGRKMPVDENGQATNLPFYNQTGQINTIPDSAISTLQWEYLGEQVKVDPGVDTEVNFGTQVRKLIWSMMFEGGAAKPITVSTPEGNKTLSSAEVQGLYDEYTGIINEMLEESEQALMTEMGLSMNAEGDYVFSKDPEQVVKMIEVEMRRMDYPENSIDGMRMMFASEVKKVDVLPNKREVEQLLMSLAKNRVMRQQMPGSMRVLVANTGFESKRESNMEILRSNDLGFYASKDGVTKRAEIKIPLPKEWIKAIYSMTGTSKSQDLGVALRAFNQMIGEGKVDENILYRTAYRIPNHGLPATDAFIVKEFLHPAAGNIVVPPSEIVVKAGSDYDIDKLTVFDRNLEVTEEGIKYVTEGRKGKENRLMEIMESIILAPENYKDLTQPTDTKELKDLAKVVRKAKKYEGLPKSGLGMLGFKNIVRVARSFWSGKDGVGITAVNLTSHTIAQAARLRYISRTPLIFASAPENELLAMQDNATAIDLSRAYDSKGNSIIKTLGMFLNAYVDVAKDDFVMDINAGPAFSGVYMFLIRAGVPLDTIVYFMNQPAVNQVLLRLDTQQAEIFEGSKGLDGKPLNKSRAEIFTNVRDMFRTSMKSDAPLTDAELIKAMNNDISSVQEFNAIQIQVLNALEAYIEAAQDLRNLTQASNFDTAFGKTWRSPQLRESKLGSLVQKNVFENMEAYVDSPLLQGFRTKSSNSGNYFKSLFISASPGVAKFVEPVLDIITENSNVSGVSPLATERALKALEDDLTTFLLETVKANGKVLIDKAEKLLFGAASLPLRIEQAKKMPALRGNYLLDKLTALVAPIREGRLLSPDSMQLFSNKLNSQESAALVDGFVELMAVNSSLAQDVADFLVIQTGVGFSPKSGIRIIPAGLYIDRAIEVLKTVEGQNVDNLMKEFKIQFFQNNVHLSGVAPTLKKNYDDQTSFKHTFYGNSTAPEYVSNTFSFLEDLGETDEQGQPKKTRKYHRALYRRAGIEQRSKEMNNKIVGITEATYTRVGEKGVVNSFKEYYPTGRLSMLPVNNLKFTSVKVADPKLTNPMGKLPAALKTEEGKSSAATELIRALSAELTPDQYNYLLKNYSVAGLVGAINKSSGTFEEMISDAVEHWRTLAEKNC